MNKMIEEKITKIIHSDIESLEAFQSSLLIFVNPLNLYNASHSKTISMSIVVIFCFLCIFVGLFNIYSLFVENLKYRLQIARFHWIMNIFITIHILNNDILLIDKSLLSYYVVQSFFCLFVISRLYLEYTSKQKG